MQQPIPILSTILLFTLFQEHLGQADPASRFGEGTDLHADATSSRFGEIGGCICQNRRTLCAPHAPSASCPKSRRTRPPTTDHIHSILEM